ncbi:MAG: hypothetical protein Q9220_004334 [cf. Caloplaca sp. 1 TL-2023]
MFEPGTRVEGCLACALSRLYNDFGAMDALGVLAGSARRDRSGRKTVQLVDEGWLGWWFEGEGSKERIRAIQKDRRIAKKQAAGTLDNHEWKGPDEGNGEWLGAGVTDWKNPGWERKIQQQPPRPYRPDGLTLFTNIEERNGQWMERERSKDRDDRKRADRESGEEKRFSGSDASTLVASPTSSPRPKRMTDTSSVASTTPKKSSIRPLVHLASNPKWGDMSQQSAIPAPLGVAGRHITHSQRPLSERSSTAASTDSEWWNNGVLDDEEIVVPSALGSKDEESSISAYSDDEDNETRQRYLDEHEELLKLAKGMMRSELPHTQDYLDSLPPRPVTKEWSYGHVGNTAWRLRMETRPSTCVGR